MSEVSISPEVVHTLVDAARAYGFDKPTDSQRTLILAHYAESNCIRGTARAFGIPHTTLVGWLADDESAELVDQIRTVLRSEVICDVIAASKEALRMTRERLVRGDAITVDKRIEYVPPKAKDCAVIASVMMDKAQILIGTMGNAVPTGRQMDKLASALLDRAKAIESAPKSKPNAVVPVDIEGLIG